MSEHTLKDACNDKFKTCIKQGLPLWFLKVHGSRFQRAGVPDFLVCYNGHFHAIELKLPGEQPTPIQVLELRDIARAHGTAGVATSWRQVCDILHLPQWCHQL